jgi:predicted ATPase
MIQTAHPLVGRDREFGALQRLLQEARAGAPCFVVVSGEPGIGKTSLITAFGRAAESGGCFALSGKATELERDFAFGLIVDALDDHLAHLTRVRSTAWRPTSWESLSPHFFPRCGRCGRRAHGQAAPPSGSAPSTRRGS